MVLMMLRVIWGSVDEGRRALSEGTLLHFPAALAAAHNTALRAGRILSTTTALRRLARVVMESLWRRRGIKTEGDSGLRDVLLPDTYSRKYCRPYLFLCDTMYAFELCKKISFEIQMGVTE